MLPETNCKYENHVTDQLLNLRRNLKYYIYIYGHVIYSAQNADIFSGIHFFLDVTVLQRLRKVRVMSVG